MSPTPGNINARKLEDVLYSGYVAQGDVVESFERKFENYTGKGSTLSLNSGTAALHIALSFSGRKRRG